MNNLFFTNEFIPYVNTFGLHNERRLTPYESAIYQRIIEDLNYILEHFRNEYFANGYRDEDSLRKTLLELSLYLLSTGDDIFSKYCTSDKIPFYIVFSVEDAFYYLKKVILRSVENYDIFLSIRMQYYNSQYKKINEAINKFGKSSDEAYEAYHEIVDIMVEQPLTPIRMIHLLDSEIEFTVPVAKIKPSSVAFFTGFLLRKALPAWRVRLDRAFNIPKQ